jgi:cbb3-type cytochrome oxidase maturation protein
MDVIYGLIPGMIIMGLLAVGVLFWAAKSGQFEDLEGEASRILMDDDVQFKPKKPTADAEEGEKEERQ